MLYHIVKSNEGDVLMKYGFIGAGNMAGAIIKGMTVGTKSFDGKDIFVYDVSKDALDSLTSVCGTNSCASAEEVVKSADVIVFAVKPNVLADAVSPLKDIIAEKSPLVISIAAGKDIAFLEGLFTSKLPIIRVMPNINAKVGAATSAFCANSAVTDEQKEILKSLFSTVGSVTELPEKLFTIHSVIGGAAPAFAYLYIDSLARAAVKAGMPKKQALELTAQTVLGSAKMVLESDEHPWALIDQVCSPGGTTIEGVVKLQECGFENALCKAFDAVLEKDKKL